MVTYCLHARIIKTDQGKPSQLLQLKVELQIEYEHLFVNSQKNMSSPLFSFTCQINHPVDGLCVRDQHFLFQLTPILCLFLPPLRGRFATISPTGSAGYLCGVENRWAGVTYPPCITAKITQERQLYLEQYRRNMNTRLADLHVNRCTERRQYICMSYYENNNNIIGESPCWHHTAVQVRIPQCNFLVHLTVFMVVTQACNNYYSYNSYYMPMG